MSGQIAVVRSGLVRDRKEVIEDWNRLRFIQDRQGEARGWLLEVMRCVQKLGRPDFTLADVYSFEAELSANFPRNNNVRPKIRQQLQVLRDGGYLEFVGNGRYHIR